MFGSFRLAGFFAAVALVLPLSGCPHGPAPDVADASSADADSDASVVIGTHVQWKQQPDDFHRITDGSELPIVLGHQGLWMVVLAVRVDETLVPGMVDLLVRMEAADTALGELQLVERPLDPELDGYGYVYDIWYIVSDPSLATYDALLTVEVAHDSGFETTVEHSVVLSGGI